MYKMLILSGPIYTAPCNVTQCKLISWYSIWRQKKSSNHLNTKYQYEHKFYCMFVCFYHFIDNSLICLCCLSIQQRLLYAYMTCLQLLMMCCGTLSLLQNLQDKCQRCQPLPQAQLKLQIWCVPSTLMGKRDRKRLFSNCLASPLI